MCPFPFCRKQVDRVIMNAAPWKPRIVEKEIKECLLCEVKKEASKAADRTEKTKAPTTKEKGEASKAAGRAQKINSSAPKAKEEDSKLGERTQKSKSESPKATGPDQEAAIPTCSAVHGDT